MRVPNHIAALHVCCAILLTPTSPLLSGLPAKVTRKPILASPSHRCAIVTLPKHCRSLK